MRCNTVNIENKLFNLPLPLIDNFNSTEAAILLIYAMTLGDFPISQNMTKLEFILHFKDGKQIQPPVVRRAKHL